MTERPQTLREELANTLSHGLGLLLALASLPVVLNLGEGQGGHTQAGAFVFSLTMILLYLASAVYHALPHGLAKQWFNRLDHAAIYLFIAGSYTPFALGQMDGSSGWASFTMVWCLALAGMVAKVRNRLRHPLGSTAMYFALGWLAFIAAGPLIERMPPDALMLLLAGGGAYTVGAVFFLLDHRVRYGHFVWHLFVLAGSTCHFFAALWHLV
ncbi:MAG: hemolysin III family protein [Rubrivivax sp.]|nr:hemolysin III family protein [Rubrivivax sp.]